ncbi:MAG: carbohydrate ABC transporter substrate-binding protein, partial [Mycetocola sp.]
MNLSRRTKLATGLAGAAAFALLATGCAPQGASAGDEQIELSVTTFGTFGYDELYKEYEKANPNITIKADNIDTGGNART